MQNVGHGMARVKFSFFNVLEGGTKMVASISLTVTSKIYFVNLGW